MLKIVQVVGSPSGPLVHLQMLQVDETDGHTVDDIARAPRVAGCEINAGDAYPPTNK